MVLSVFNHEQENLYNSMANLCMAAMTSASINQNTLTHNILRRRFICKSMTKTAPEDAPVQLDRRSGNYQPSYWDHIYILSIDNKYVKEKEVITRDVLKTKVKKMLDFDTKNRLEQLELIDDLQKLGISYHFEQEVNSLLTNLHHTNGKNVFKWDKEEDLHAAALEFRLLRQHGFEMSEDILDVIMDKRENNLFKNSDIKSIISLYEASYLSTKSDTKLHSVIRPFAIEQIKKFIDSQHDDGEKAIHALEMPYHWGMRRLETKWYIDTYEKKHDKNLVLLDFAKIDFNTLQTTHQEDLKYISRWWQETCLGDQLPFVRDRIVENYFWTVGFISEPKFDDIRRIMAKVVTFIITIDDIYDIYGTIEELELFTTMVENWDVNRLGELPEYMRLCYLTLHNETNAIGCDILKHKKINVIPFLRKSWADVFKTFLIEAKWYKSGYKPSVDEYLQNAWISSAVPTVLIHIYCLLSDKISIQFLESLSEHQQHIVRCSSKILRLANDLGTSQNELARGDVFKSVQCYMYETGASEEKARAHVQQMISDTWEEMNYEAKTANSSRWFVETAINIARMSQCMYQYGDGHGSPDKAKILDRIQSLLFNPVPFD